MNNRAKQRRGRVRGQVQVFEPWSMVQQFLRCMHRDQRGGIGVLLLMTVLALVGLLGVMWNSSEYATRRQNAQNAADSVAHGTYTAISRTNNLVTATNMLMCENLSAEVIMDSVMPTETAVENRLTSEQQTANRLLIGTQAGVPEIGIPDTEYFEQLLGLGAWAKSGQGATLLPQQATLAQQITTYLPIATAGMTPARAAQFVAMENNALRRNLIGLTWLQGTWVGGQNPAFPALPAAPTANGNTGMQSIVNDWVENQVKGRLNAILAAIPNEQAYLDQFASQAEPALSMTTPAQLQARRDSMFAYQQQIRDMTATVVEQQRADLAAFYKVNLTLALPAAPGSQGGPAEVDPPLKDAGDVPGNVHTDSIRPRYPQAAINAFGTDSPIINIDAINVNSNDPTGFDTIWHPGVDESTPPPTYMASGQTYNATFHVNGGEFGQVYCAPLARYFNDRVSRDMQGLLGYMTSLDQVRANVRAQVYPMPYIPNMPDLPQNIPDPAPTALTPGPINIPPDVLLRLPVPGGLSAANLAAITNINTQITAYNIGVTNYANELRNLPNDLDREYQSMQLFVDQATQSFAANAWTGWVQHYQFNVLQDFGTLKQFTVLKTYALRPIPDWAKPGMWNSAQQYVSTKVYNDDMTAGFTQQVQRSLQNWLIGVYTQANPQQAARLIRRQAQLDSQAAAGPIAQVILQRGADAISREVADEWVSREWPYEITPPDQPIPPSVGMGYDDRINFFTVLGGAQTTNGSNPLPFMNGLFRASGHPMVAYAQGETFNWMEFNAAYGGGDRYDQVTADGWNVVSGAPACWRLSSIGGWNWQPRLSFSDALYPALQNNTEFQDYFNQTGVSGGSSNDLNQLNDH